MSSRPGARIALLATSAAATVVLPLPAAAAGALNLIPDPIVLLANFALLLLLIYPVNRWLLRPLLELAAKREERTAGARERAAQLGAETAALLRSVETRLQGARVEARARQLAIEERSQTEERRQLAEARSTAAAQIQEVRSAIAGELEGARARLRDDAVSLAREAASKILGREL
jgi:F-type H+-transporting ATPase subunit b